MTDTEIVVLSLKDMQRRSFPVPGAEDLSVSPDGRSIVFWRREGSNENEADGWMLYRLNVLTGEIAFWGRRDDGRGVVGPAYWHPDSGKFLITTFDVDAKNERSNVTDRWFSTDLEELGKPKSPPLVIMQNRYPWASENP